MGTLTTGSGRTGRVEVTVVDGVALVELCDPNQNNALSAELVHDLESALQHVGEQPSVRAVVLAGRGETFCAGATKSMLRQLCDGAITPSEIRLPARVLDVPVPVIAALEGHAVGGGFALALAADILVMATTSRYGFNFMDLGFTPGMGTTKLAEHVLGPALARELLLTGELRAGRDLRTVGHVVERKEVRSRAMDLALRIADKPRAALVLLTRCLSAPRRAAFEHALTMESIMHELTLRDPETAARIEAVHVG